MPERARRTLLFALTFAVFPGCAQPQRSTFDLQTPRMVVWTHVDAKELRHSLQAEGALVEEKGTDGGLFVVGGTGTLRWPSTEIILAPNEIIVNGVRVESRSSGYRNVVLEKSGRVRPDATLSYENRPPSP